MKFTLTKASPTSTKFTLAASPLQVVIDRNTPNFSSNAKVVVQIETEVTDEYVTCSDTEITSKDTILFDLKAGNYRLILLDATDDDSIVGNIS